MLIPDHHLRDLSRAWRRSYAARLRDGMPTSEAHARRLVAVHIIRKQPFFTGEPHAGN